MLQKKQLTIPIHTKASETPQDLSSIQPMGQSAQRYLYAEEPKIGINYKVAPALKS